MDESLQGQLNALGCEILAATIPGDWKHTASWCFEQLPALYENYRQTNDSRFGDEITRRVSALLKALNNSKQNGRESQKLAAYIAQRLTLLQAQFGLPGLVLKSQRVAPPRSSKTGSAFEKNKAERR
jgi:hypothetical protein